LYTEARPTVTQFWYTPCSFCPKWLGSPLFNVVEPAIEQKANLEPLFEGFKQVGFLNSLPDDGIYYKWTK